MIINCRFDIMNNSHSLHEKTILTFITNNSKRIFTKNIFLFNDEQHLGIDNIYVGNIHTMYPLINYFFYKLDNILKNNNNTINQEKLVYRINDILFDKRCKSKKIPRKIPRFGKMLM